MTVWPCLAHCLRCSKPRSHLSLGLDPGASGLLSPARKARRSSQPGRGRMIMDVSLRLGLMRVRITWPTTCGSKAFHARRATEV